MTANDWVAESALSAANGATLDNNKEERRPAAACRDLKSKWPHSDDHSGSWAALTVEDTAVSRVWTDSEKYLPGKYKITDLQGHYQLTLDDSLYVCSLLNEIRCSFTQKSQIVHETKLGIPIRKTQRIGQMTCVGVLTLEKKNIQEYRSTEECQKFYKCSPACEKPNKTTSLNKTELSYPEFFKCILLQGANTGKSCLSWISIWQAQNITNKVDISSRTLR